VLVNSGSTTAAARAAVEPNLAALDQASAQALIDNAAIPGNWDTVAVSIADQLALWVTTNIIP